MSMNFAKVPTDGPILISEVEFNFKQSVPGDTVTKFNFEILDASDLNPRPDGTSEARLRVFVTGSVNSGNEKTVTDVALFVRELAFILDKNAAQIAPTINPVVDEFATAPAKPKAVLPE